MNEQNKQTLEKLTKLTELTNFDADLCPNNPINRKAAKERGLIYDSKKKVYADSGECPVRDRYGQALG